MSKICDFGTCPHQVTDGFADIWLSVSGAEDEVLDIYKDSDVRLVKVNDFGDGVFRFNVMVIPAFKSSAATAQKGNHGHNL